MLNPKKQVSELLSPTPNPDIPSLAGLFICAGHALAGSEVDGAGAGGVPVHHMAPPTDPLIVLHSLSERGRNNTHTYESNSTNNMGSHSHRKLYSDASPHYYNILILVTFSKKLTFRGITAE